MFLYRSCKYCKRRGKWHVVWWVQPQIVKDPQRTYRKRLGVKRARPWNRLQRATNPSPISRCFLRLQRGCDDLLTASGGVRPEFVDFCHCCLILFCLLTAFLSLFSSSCSSPRIHATSILFVTDDPSRPNISANSRVLMGAPCPERLLPLSPLLSTDSYSCRIPLAASTARRLCSIHHLFDAGPPDHLRHRSLITDPMLDLV